jgi:hypothetical protein
MIRMLCRGALIALTVTGAAACAAPVRESADDDDQALSETSGLITKAPRPDLVPEIVSGAACPLNSGATVHFRVANRGNANAPASVVRVEIKFQGANGPFNSIMDIAIPALAPGQSASQGSSGGFTVDLAFFNGDLPWGTITSWRLAADDAGQAQESNELNNYLNDAGQCFVD